MELICSLAGRVLQEAAANQLPGAGRTALHLHRGPPPPGPADAATGCPPRTGGSATPPSPRRRSAECRRSALVAGLGGSASAPRERLAVAGPPQSDRVQSVWLYI